MNMKLVLVVLKMQLIRIPIHFVNFLVLLMNTSILISTKKLLCLHWRYSLRKINCLFKTKGFEEVYHLKGGILNYLKTVPQTKSRWEGECFVFDNRVSVNHNLKKGDYDQCHACRMPICDEDKLSEYYQKGISCPHCYALTDDQRKKFEERQKQIQLAQERGNPYRRSSQSKKTEGSTLPS